MRLLLHVFVNIIILLMFLVGPGNGHADPKPLRPIAKKPHHILFLNTFQVGLPIPDSIDKGFVSGLRKGGGSTKDIFVEHLDLAREHGKKYRTLLSGLFHHKMAGKHIDIVLAEGAPAVNFLVTEGKGLFPNIPIVTLIAPDIKSQVDNSHRIINIPWQVDNAGTLNIALDLFPNTRRVLVVTGAHDTILPFLEYAKEAFSPWKNTLDFEYTDAMTYEQMLLRTATMPPNSIIIYSPYFSDTSGRSFVPADVVAKICRSASAPVFANLEQFLGRGIVGGSLLKTENMGQQAAQIALNYLTGHLKLTKQVTTFPPLIRTMFDWNELVRWKANMSALPKKSIIINRPQTLWSQHKTAVSVTLAVFLALNGLIFTLLILNRRLKRLTATVSKSESHYRSIFVNSLIGVTVTNQNFIFTDVNEAFCKMLEYSKKELIGKKTIQDVSHPDDAAQSMKMLNKLVQHEVDSYTIEKRYISKTGKIIPSLVYVRGHYTVNGEYDGTTASNLDITDRKKTEQLLICNEDKYRTLFNNSEIAMFRSRLDGSETLEVNQKFLDLVGKTREETVGKPSLLLWEDQKEREKMVRRLLAEGSVSEFELTIRNRQRGLRKCTTTLRLYRELGIVEGSIIDITERTLAEEEKAKMQAQLYQAQKMESIGQLAGGVAHDFNNMLGVILGHTDLAMDEIESAHPVYSDLQEIRGAAERSAGIVRQLLAFARKQMVVPKVIDLNKTVEGMLKMLTRLIGEDIELVWKPTADLWQVNIDPSQVDQILANLCVNARDAISHVGSIVVETENIIIDEKYAGENAHAVPGDFVVLKIKDTGAGIPKELLAHIFEPFFTTKGVGKGTGLGLSTVYGIVKQNKGFIDVSSEKGQTTVSVFLPRYVGPQRQNDPQVALSPVEGGHETVLLVEDEPTIIQMTTSMLERLGYKVLPAEKPSDAIRQVEEYGEQINLLMTDVIMPEMNGKDLAEKIMAIRPDIKCIFMSGYTADTVGKQGILNEETFFIQKPFSKRGLAEKIRMALSSS